MLQIQKTMTQKSEVQVRSFLQKCAIVLFAFLPVGFSFFAQWSYILSIWNSYVFLVIGLLVVLIISPLIFWVYQNSFLNFLESKPFFLVLWLVALGVGLRVVLLPVISTNFVSDMEDIHNFAMDVAAGNPLTNLQNYPNIPRSIFLNMSGFVLGGIYKIFPPSFTTAKLCMVVLSGFTIGLVYKTGRKICNSRAGFVAALTFAVFPALILYTGVLSGEHVAVFLIAGIILLYMKIHEHKNNKAYYLIGYLLMGGLIGLIDWFRPVGIILLISIIVTELIYVQKRKLLITFTALAGLFVGSLFITNLAVLISESVFQVDVLPASQRVGHYILVGLNPETEGTINGEDYEIANTTYEKFGDDHWSAQRYLIQLALERLKGHSVLRLFWVKFDRMWANQDALFGYSLIGSDDGEMVLLMEYLEVFLYLLITIFVGFHAVKSIFRRPHPAVFVMQLFILGFALLLLVVEAQNRYVIIVFPYLLLLAAFGLEEALGKNLTAS
jgi:Dolichyl-phosphate-mannose-protein mannosyltransferase